jgi:hypothetical protein
MLFLAARARRTGGRAGQEDMRKTSMSRPLKIGRKAGPSREANLVSLQFYQYAAAFARGLLGTGPAPAGQARFSTQLLYSTLEIHHG